MKIIYKQTILAQVSEWQLDAMAKKKEIKKIQLTKSEFEQLKTEISVIQPIILLGIEIEIEGQV